MLFIKIKKVVFASSILLLGAKYVSNLLMLFVKIKKVVFASSVLLLGAKYVKSVRVRGLVILFRLVGRTDGWSGENG